MKSALDSTLTLPLRREWIGRLGDYVIPIFGVVFLIGMAVTFLSVAESTEWRTCFVYAAQQMEQGQRIVVPERGEPYAYLPAMAMLTIPLANLSPYPAILGWYAVNAVACVVIFFCAWKLTGGQRFIGLDQRWLTILGLGLILSLRFCMIGLGHQQFDAVIAALLFGGCYLLWRGRDLAGAACLGAAAAMKCTPLLFAPYLVWRGKWRAALMMLTVTVGLNVAPDLLWPQTSGRSYLTDWKETFLDPMRDRAPGAWITTIYHNQSLGGLLNRLYRFGLPLEFREDSFPGRSLSAGETQGLKLAFYASALVLLGITVWRCGAPGRPAPTVLADAGEVPLEKLRLGFEASALIALMLLLSPMSSLTHYVVLVLPSFLIARIVVDRAYPNSRWIFAALLVCGSLAAKDLIGRPLGNLAKVWGLPTWFVLLSLLAMWLALGSLPPNNLVRDARSD